MTSGLPAVARIVVIGGGVGGASVAFHLAELGQTDALVLERAELTSGSTFHSAGLVGQLRSDPTLTRMNMYSVELYRRLDEGEHPVGWNECGGLRLASSEQRLAEIARQLSWARSFGMDLELLSAVQAQELFGLMSTGGVLGAAYSPTDGYIDPSRLCYSLAAGARARGVQIMGNTRVVGIEVDRGRVRAVHTDQGRVQCEVVVNCGGMFAAEIARMAGVRIPIVAMSHQYLITEALFTHRAVPLPTLRDPDLLVYFRQEVDGLVMGGYERQSAPWMASETSFDAIPADFNGKLLEPVWDRMEEIATNSQIRVPLMSRAGIKRIINGPEAFTPDNEFCLGETEVDGFFVAAGFCAHGIAGAGGIGKVMAEWIVDGEPSMDVSHMDVRRFGSQYRSPALTLARTVESYETYYDIRYPHLERTSARPLRVSAAYEWHLKHEAQMGEKSCWERVNYYHCNADVSVESLRPRGWAGLGWSSAIAVEHSAARSTAALFDESSFAKIEVSGPGAAVLMQWVCDNDVARAVGAVTYTQALNARGGIEADFTVTRIAEDRFRIVTGTASGSRDLSWISRQARMTNAEVSILDVTDDYSCFALWGPRARDILSPITDADLSNEAFRYLTAEAVQVAGIATFAARVTYVGELGWELYCDRADGADLWTAVLAAGEPSGLIPGGYRAIESLRLEKGYRAWGTDLTSETTPDQAGLGFCVRTKKAGGFNGLGGVLASRARTDQPSLACIVLDDPRSVVLGSEPIRYDGAIVGRVTSGGYGYSVGASIAYGYLPPTVATEGKRVSIDLFGRWVGGVVSPQPLYDPTGERVRA